MTILRHARIACAATLVTVIVATVAARVGGAPATPGALTKPAQPAQSPVCGITGPCAIKPLSIPPPLTNRAAALELSGLAWAPSLDRYLGVVDEGVDIGNRLSFVFALDRFGVVDAEPVPVVGEVELDDVEALTPGPERTYFLLTSHAPNRHGKVGKERRRLLQLRLEERQLRITGELDLFDGKGEVPRQIEKLGLPRATPVDLEGLAFFDGALYIGLKEPLLPRGSAIVLRLDRPSEAFAAGKLPKKALSFWGDVGLTATSPAGVKVPQGIADLRLRSRRCAVSVRQFAQERGTRRRRDIVANRPAAGWTDDRHGVAPVPRFEARGRGGGTRGDDAGAGLRPRWPRAAMDDVAAT